MSKKMYVVKWANDDIAIIAASSKTEIFDMMDAEADPSDQKIKEIPAKIQVYIDSKGCIGDDLREFINILDESDTWDTIDESYARSYYEAIAKAAKEVKKRESKKASKRK